MHLEAECVLQVIAWLLVRQAGDCCCLLSYIYDLEIASFGQRAGNFVDLLGSGYPMCFTAEVKLRKRADVTEFADADVSVVVG